MTAKECAAAMHLSVLAVRTVAGYCGMAGCGENDELSPEMVTLIAQRLGRPVPVMAEEKPVPKEEPPKEPVPPPRVPSKEEATDREAAAKNALEHMVKNYKVFMDTCSLLNPNAELFFEHLTPLLRTYNNPLIIPVRVVEEVQKKQADTSNEELARCARHALRWLKKLQGENLVVFRGEESDNFADNVFHTIFTKFRLQHKLLLITEDKRLGHDIMALNNIQSQRGFPVSVKRLSKYGYLAALGEPTPVSDRTDKTVTDTTHPPKKQERTTVKKQPLFRMCAGMPPQTDSLLPVSLIPEAGDSVFTYTTDWVSLQLGEKIASGGEGVIYRTNTPYVAKIYKKENNTRLKYDKIRKMIENRLQYPGICFPVGMIYNSAHEFVGYLMPEAKGREIQRSIFIKPVFQKVFPGWKRRDTVELSVTILEKIKYLHDRNILMGDLNPGNILVVSPKEVYFVDTDSYQIEDLPCPVGTINYTAPEIQGKKYSEFLRSPGNENFAVATLLFMLMLPGKAPYAQQGGGNQAENIRSMNFAYPFGEIGSKNAPEGAWRFIWSHLTYDIKKAFFNTFHKDGESNQESNRLNVDQWLSLFRYYLRLLDEGKLAAQDPMSEDLFPTRPKLSSKVTYRNCLDCGEPTNVDHLREGRCPTCLKKGTVETCHACKREFIFTNYRKLVKKQAKPGLCPTCRERGDEVYTQLTCTEGGHSFPLTFGELDFFLSKGYDLPKRCKQHRGRPAPTGGTGKRPASYMPPPMPTGKTTPSGSTGKAKPSPSEFDYDDLFRTRKDTTPKPDGSGTKCFITTAVCEYMGKDDRCVELQTLRHFRDHYLAFQPGGQELIDRYYEEAPKIVRCIKASPHYAAICQDLWDSYLAPCLAMIAAGDNEGCKQRYIRMVEQCSAWAAKQG